MTDPRPQCTRQTHVRVGYVCPGYCRTPNCPDRHGNHGDAWHYYVKAPGLGGLELRLFTPFLPTHIPEERRLEFARGTAWVYRDDPRAHRRAGFSSACGFVYHVPWRLSREAVREQRAGHRGCSLAEPCLDASETNSLYADDFVAAQFQVPAENDPQQPESFWLALEAEFWRMHDEAQVARREDGDLFWAQCSTCCGEGTVAHTLRGRSA